jgi:hypothetical protein
MLIDFSQPLLDLDGNEIKTKEDDKIPYTLKRTCVEALMAQYKDEGELSGTEKVKRYDLALAIYGSKEPLDLQSEDVAFIKQLIGKAFSTLVVGQTWKMLG